MKYFLYLIKVIWISTKRFCFTGNYTLYVSALTYTTLLSIVPLLSISVFFLTIFPIFSKYILISDSYILKNLIPSAATTIQVYIQTFAQQAARLPILSIIFLIITAIMMINTIDDTINDIWNITKRRKKLYVWLFYSIILLSAPILLGLSVFFTSYLFSTYFTSLTSFLLLLVPLLINTIILSLFYIYGPNTYVKKSDGLLCGFIAALFIEIAKILFALWISYFSTYELIYGVFSTLPIFLIWLYICWFIVLWGALVTHTLSLGIESERHALRKRDL